MSRSVLQSLDWTHGVLYGVEMDLFSFLCQTTHWITRNFSFILFPHQPLEEGFGQGIWITVIYTFMPLPKPPTIRKNPLGRAGFGGERMQILAHRLSPSCLSSSFSNLWALPFETSPNPSLPRWLWVYLDSPSRIFLIRYKGMNILL